MTKGLVRAPANTNWLTLLSVRPSRVDPRTSREVCAMELKRREPSEHRLVVMEKVSRELSEPMRERFPISNDAMEQFEPKIVMLSTDKGLARATSNDRMLPIKLVGKDVDSSPDGDTADMPVMERADLMYEREGKEMASKTSLLEVETMLSDPPTDTNDGKKNEVEKFRLPAMVMLPKTV